jgi:hypothetical protein
MFPLKLDLKVRGILSEKKQSIYESGDFSMNGAIGELTRNPLMGILP